MNAGMVIVGAGECGARAALALREQGYSGAVTLIGEEPHLPYERPPLSKAAITDTAHPLPKWIATDQQFGDAGIAVLQSRRVTGIERMSRTVSFTDGDTFGYDKLLLATGATPRRLALKGSDTSGLVYLRTFDDALQLRARCGAGTRVIIVGGGFIGLELAASARLRGAAVTVIESQPRLLLRGVPAEIAAAVAARHRAGGVEILTGAGIASIRRNGVATVKLADGRELSGDLVIAGIGATPSTDLAAAAGLAIDNGVAVDATLRTSDEAIFAAGDCCSFPLPLYGGRRVRLESWRNAQEQGTLAARNLLGASAPISAVPWFWSDQFELGLQMSGLAEGAATHIRRDLGNDAFVLFHLAPDGRLLAASGIGPGTTVARDIKIAEMLIGRRAAPDPGRLAQSDFKLKQLLAA